jgi:hypothetical protein
MDLALISSTLSSLSARVDARNSEIMMYVASNFGSRVAVHISDHGRPTLIDESVVDLIQQNWPVFHWRVEAGSDLSAGAQIQADGIVFASSLKEAVLRTCVEREENRMRDLACIADSEDGAAQFK